MYKVDQSILKCEYIRYLPAETSIMKTPNSQICINKPREDFVISLLNSYFDLNLKLSKKQMIRDMQTVTIYG